MAITEVLMPLMGEGVNEATLVRWLKKPGDRVDANEPLLEVSTDKVDTEIPAPSAGVVIDQLFKEGDVLTVNHVIAHIGDSMEEKPGAKSAVEKPAAKTPVAATNGRMETTASVAATRPVTDNGPVRSSPLVRKMAKDANVDLQHVSGSGLHGRITKQDLLGYMEGGAPRIQQQPAANIVPAAAVAAPIASTPQRLKTTIEGENEFLEGVPVVREKMSRMRKLIADHMIESVRTSPHVTTVFEVDMHKVVALREKYKNEFAARTGFNLTYTPFLIHAAVQAIKEHPIINTSVDGDDILYKKDVNVGCAVAIGDGLIVPVIKRAQELSLHGIACRLNDLVVRARAKKLNPDDVKGGTFSITNPGGWGSIVSAPIINQPQVAILGIGAIVKRPVVVDDMIAVRPLMQISLTFDHRVVDGEGGAKYLATLKSILENYAELPF